MTHDELAEDLAAHLRASGDVMTWCDMQMGPSGSQRPDVYAIPKTYSRFAPISYEVKVSTADFRGDVTAGKWMGYLKYSAGVVFACEHGLLTKDMIPKAAGLIVRGPSGQWRSAKRPTLTPCESLPKDVWMKMLIDGVDRAGQVRSQRFVNEYAAIEKLRKSLGKDVADVVRGLREGRMMAGHYEAEATKAYQKHAELETRLREQSKALGDRMRREHAQGVVRLEALVGCSIDSYQFGREFGRFLDQLSTDTRIAAAASHLRQAISSLTAASEGLSRIPVDKAKDRLTNLTTDGEMSTL